MQHAGAGREQQAKVALAKFKAMHPPSPPAEAMVLPCNTTRQRCMNVC
jgi:hypothetical protein